MVCGQAHPQKNSSKYDGKKNDENHEGEKPDSKNEKILWPEDLPEKNKLTFQHIE